MTCYNNSVMIHILVLLQAIRMCSLVMWRWC